MNTRLNRTTNTLVVSVIAFCFLGVGRLGATEAVGCPATHPNDSARPAETAAPVQAAGQMPLGIGDRLKITFFEMMDVPVKDAVTLDQPRGLLQTFYQRMDLSGEYDIQPDGTITIPRLGVFQTCGRGSREVSREMEAAFKSALGRDSNTTITVLERQPIYVVGPVKSAGSYRYVPGMIVLHAIALAGGIDRSASQVNQLSDFLREVEKVKDAGDKLKHLLAHRDRLIAEHDGAPTANPSTHLIEVAGEDQAAKLIAVENDARAQAERVRKDEAAARQVATAFLNSQLAILRSRVGYFGRQSEPRRTRLKILQQLDTNGLANKNNILSMESEVADVEGRQQEFLVTISQIEQKLAEGERSEARAKTDYHDAVEKEIAAVTEEISAIERARAFSMSISSVMRPEIGDLSGTQIEIVRRGPLGVSIIPAEETSELLPGDVVRISAANHRMVTSDALSDPR
jgi:polysaccharide biosynthesis/export protein ExoF